MEDTNIMTTTIRTDEDVTPRRRGDATVGGGRTPSKRLGLLSQTGNKEEGTRTRSVSTSSRTSIGEGGDDEGDISIVSSGDEGSDGSFRTPPARTPRRVETRGRLPKDPVARAVKLEANRLRSTIRKLESDKAKAEERAQQAEELTEMVGGSLGGWETVAPTRAAPPAVNLPAVEKMEENMAAKETAAIAEAIAKHVERVDHIAYVAQNLSGQSKRELRMAALVGRAGVRILSRRAADPPALEDRRADALRRKVELLEREAREKDRRIAELEQKFAELRDLRDLDPEPVQRKSPREIRSPGDKRKAAVGASGSPEWIPQSKGDFERYLQRTVLSQLSNYMENWLREAWEPRALQLLAATAAPATPRTPTAGVPWALGVGRGSAALDAPSGPTSGTEVETSGPEGAGVPQPGKRKRGEAGAPTPSPEEGPVKPPQEETWAQVVGKKVAKKARKAAAADKEETPLQERQQQRRLQQQQQRKQPPLRQQKQPKKRGTPVRGTRQPMQGQGGAVTPATGPRGKSAPQLQREQQQQQKQPRRQMQQGQQQQQPQQQQQRKRRPLPRPPRTAAVVLTAPEGSYAEAMRVAQERVTLADLGIEGLRPRRARTDALILEVAGAGGPEKADRLAAAMSGALSGIEGIKVTRPKKMKEILLRDLQEAATPEFIAGEIARAGGCQPVDVKVGPVRMGPTGLGVAWARCPLAAAAALSKAGKARIGWTWSRVELLAERPLQCYKCMELGHVRQRCPNEGTEWGDRCFRCGLAGHRSADCASSPRCPVCKDSGGPARHRIGGPSCRAGPVGGKPVGPKAGTPVAPRAVSPRGGGTPSVVPAAAAGGVLLAAVEAAAAAGATDVVEEEVPLPQRKKGKAARERKEEETTATAAAATTTDEAMEVVEVSEGGEEGAGGADSVTA